MRRILIVDDNVDVARSLWILLKQMGHQVEVAHDGRSALDTARRQRPEVLFIDLAMPQMDGYELVQRLRREPQLERSLMVAMSGFGLDEDRARTQRAGFDQHLMKPVDPNFLESLLGPRS